MKQKFEFPPNIDKIRARFDIEGKPVVFTYGDTLYNPHKGNIERHLYVHEETHVKQQGDNPEAWWDEYMTNDQFRLAQEVMAYRNQYNYIKDTLKNREVVNKFLNKIASDLSSEIYGNICTKSEALRLIQNK